MEIFFDIATISFAFAINLVKSWNATVILSSVALCCSSILLSMPTIPDLILELVGVTAGLGVELGLEVTDDTVEPGLSQALAATASLRAL